MAAPLTIESTGSADAAAVRVLAEQASTDAGSPVLNEQSLIALAGATDSAPIVLLARAGANPVAAAVIEIADAASTVELVLPDGDHAGDAGPALLDAVLAEDRIPADRPVLLWAHGRGSRTAPLADGRGYEAIRSLYVLRRPGALAIDDAPFPPGVDLSTFRPGVDNTDWLGVNAAAFAAHAEQGRWSAADLQARIDEEWFDPTGFFLARSRATGELLGFHWTKTERDEPGGPITGGEVYVIGIAPAAAGLRLGSALLAVGLTHLQSIGAPVVDLYVDGDNTGARALYANRGFAEHNLDVCYRMR